MRTTKLVMVWSNSTAYNLIRGKLYPAIATTPPKRTTAIFLLSLIELLGTLLVLWRWRLKKAAGMSKIIGCCAAGFSIWLLSLSPASAQTANDKLLTFQKFVNGEVPIKEATVYRTLSKPNGNLLNQEWFRFGYQDGTWYVQRLQPDPNDPAKLIPRANHTVCGASTTEYWTIDDRNIHLVDKVYGSNSIPDTFGELYRNLLFSTLSLGLPRQRSVLKLGDAQIRWDGLTFRTKVPSKWSRTGTPLATAVITGKLTLGDDGLPATGAYPGVGQLGAGIITYQYRTVTEGIPSSFVLTFPGSIFHYTFLSLTLGRNDLAQSGGYVPPMFGDMKMKRTVTIWTNSLSWSFHKGAFAPDFVVSHTKLIGSVSMILVTLIMGATLALWYRRSKAR